MTRPHVQPTEHLGHYGLLLRDGRALLVRKTRGPYAGLLDLPGGAPEAGEDWSAALAREIREELGVEMTRAYDPVEFSLQVDRDSAGEAIDFRHTGTVSQIEIDGPATLEAISADTSGCEWVDVARLEEGTVSPLVLFALQRLDG